jgi:prefoldin subunit 5
MEKMYKVSVQLGDAFKDIKEQQKELAANRNWLKDQIKDVETYVKELKIGDAELKHLIAALEETELHGGHATEELTKLGKQLRLNNSDLKDMGKTYNVLLDLKDKMAIRQLALNAAEEAQHNNSKILYALNYAAIYVVNQLGRSYMAMRKAGFDAIQTAAQGTTIIGAQFAGLMNGVIGSTAEFAAAFGGLANQLGTLTFPKEVVAEAVRLHTQFGLSTYQANHLEGQLTRMSNYSANVAVQTSKMVQGFARANDIAPGQIFQDMANNSEILAEYAGRGTAAFIKSAIAAKEMNVNLKSASAFASRMVDDFDSSLRTQAEIQTILPGMDFSQIMYASQFGTEGDVLNATKSALQGTGITSLDQLPKSVRDKLVSSLGFSKEEIQNLLGRGGPSGVKAAVEVGAGSSIANRLGDAVASFAGSTKSLEIAMWANTAMLGAKGLGGIGGALGGLADGAKGLFGKLFGGAAAAEGGLVLESAAETAGIGTATKIAAKMGGEGLAGNLPVIGPIIAGLTGAGLSLATGEGLGKALFRGGGAALGALAPGMAGMGLSLAGDVGGGALYDSLFGGTNVAGGGMSMPQNIASTGNAMTSMDGKDPNHQVVGLLTEILKATKDGKAIYIDGKRLSDSLVVAHSRG